MATNLLPPLSTTLGELRWAAVPYRVRAFLDGVTVVDSVSAALVWEPRRVVPQFAVPVADLRAQVQLAGARYELPDLDSLPPVMHPGFEPHTAPGRSVDLRPDGVRPTGALPGYVFDDVDLEGRVELDFDAFDEWRTEDEVLVGHPHDPFGRIDVSVSDRHIRVSHEGVVLAESNRAHQLWETKLPPRWYLPAEDVRLELLEASDTLTTCAYKGHASYYSVIGGPRDIAWYYPDPLQDAVPVRDLICFHAEFTDLEVDGEPVPRPRTPWSKDE